MPRDAEQFSKEQLIAQIIELNAKYKDVKTYYEFSIYPNSTKAKDEAKKIIGKCISTDINTNGGTKLKLREARQAVTNFKNYLLQKVTLQILCCFMWSAVWILQILLGILTSLFTIALPGCFTMPVSILKTNGMQVQFKQRCKQIMDDTANIGWGFHDELSDYYYYDFLRNQKKAVNVTFAKLPHLLSSF